MFTITFIQLKMLTDAIIFRRGRVLAVKFPLLAADLATERDIKEILDKNGFEMSRAMSFSIENASWVRIWS